MNSKVFLSMNCCFPICNGVGKECLIYVNVTSFALGFNKT